MSTEGTRINLGAMHALKGYRVQALYTIYRILGRTQGESFFIPEGNEDLDVLSENRKYLELVQVKNYARPINLSDIAKINHSSFLQRSVSFYNKGMRPRLTLVCYGDFGPELIELFDPNTSFTKFKSKLSPFLFNDSELEYLKTHLTLVKVSEDESYNKVLELLKSTGIYADTTNSIELLHYWIYSISEKQKEITRELLIQKLNAIGNFINERQTFQSHLFTSIRPFGDYRVKSEELEGLSRTFYKGVSAQYKHILADLDVIRPEKIDLINEKFLQENIVIVHGASGQGKSTLAYRFIQLTQPQLAYEIIILPDFQKTLEQIQALKGISNSLDLPLLLYIDVTPGNENWTLILKEFSNTPIFWFLITIREEDWNKTSNKGGEYLFEDLKLDFNENEAKELYQSLINQSQQKPFTDFEEAWLSFGGKGPLLEFSYLITQGESLSAKLRSQITALEISNPKSIGLLRLVCFADSHNARVRVEKLSHLEIYSQLRHFVEDILEREYLLVFSDDKKGLLGLHPIRSAIITDIIHANGLVYTRQESINDCLQIIDDRDLYIFLLNVFSKYPDLQANIIDELKNIEFSSWTALGGVENALLWIGVFQFVKRRRRILDEVKEIDHSLLFFSLAFNLSGYKLIDQTFSSLPLEQMLSNINSIIEAHNISKQEIFEQVGTWLARINYRNFDFYTNDDFELYGQFIFWIGYLNVQSVGLLDEHKILQASEKFNVYSLSTVLLGLNYYGTNDAKLIAKRIEPIFLQKLRMKYRIAALNLDNDGVTARFIIDLYSDYNETRKNAPHELKLEIVECLRKGLSYLDRYSTKGYGHNLFDHDESICSIGKNHLPHDLLTSLNPILSNLYFYVHRTKSWEDFVQQTLHSRSVYIKFTRALLKGLDLYNRKANIADLAILAQEFFNIYPSILKYKIFLPQIISDWTGKHSEDSSEESINKNAIESNRTFAPALKKFKSYIKARGDHFQAVDNFLSQSSKIILHKAQQWNEDTSNFNRVSSINLLEAVKHLRAYQESFKVHFAIYMSDYDLIKLEEEEKSVYNDMVLGWRTFMNNLVSDGRITPKETHSKIERIRLDYKDRLITNFKKVSGFKADFMIDFEKTSQSVIIVGNVESAFDVLRIPHVVFHVIHNSISMPDYLSLKYFMLEKYYRRYILISTISGVLLNAKGYIFELESFMNPNPDDGFSFQIPQELDQSLFRKLHLEEPPIDIKTAEGLVSSFQEIKLNLNIIIQMSELDENDLDDIGLQILQGSINDCAHRCSKAFRQFHDIMVNELSSLDLKMEQDEFSEEEREYFELLQAVFYQVQPEKSPNGEEEYEVAFDLDSITSWHQRLEEIEMDLLLIYLHMIRARMPNHKIANKLNPRF